LTAYSLRSRAGFVSHRQRSWDSPFGGVPSQKVSELLRPGSTHVPFNPAVFPPPKRRAGPTGPGFWVLPLPRVPCSRRGFSPPTAGSSRGFRPSRVLGRRPRPGFRPVSSHVLCPPGGYPPNAHAPQSIDQPSLGLIRTPYLSTEPDEATLLGFPHRLNPGHSGKSPSGLCVHLTLRPALLPATSDLWMEALALPELPGPA
jgi:hypothetical protein